ncbi:calcium-dependent phosphotriesterase [Xylariaceae sp. FL1019]|nr:calcium-dependent phosphotriesterase [Xylariaceae sp. FL1019]
MTASLFDHGVSTEISRESSTVTAFEWHNKAFGNVLGSHPRFDLLLENTVYPFAHEACVYFPSSEELFITSNRLQTDDKQRVQISRISLAETHDKYQSATQHEIRCDLIEMGNGGVNYGDGILFCAQGSRTSPSGLFWMSKNAPHGTSTILTDYYGAPFNAVNDVVVSKIDGSIWFTDPSYGAEQGYKDAPELPNQVYRYHPPGDDKADATLRAVADNFGHPNGLCFSPDESILYVTDTDKVHGSGQIRHDRPSSIYAFDIIRRHGQPFVCNRRLFAFIEAGIPDGIKCDTMGRVYSGCGDGIHVWSPGGVLLGRLQIEGGVANFCFGRKGEIYALNEHRLWKITIASHITGALLADLVTSEKATHNCTLVPSQI